MRIGFLLRTLEARAQGLRQARIEFGLRIHLQDLMYAADPDFSLADEIQENLEIAQHSARLVFANSLLMENPLVFR